MPELTGGCLCGSVRYTARTEPIFFSLCHCRDCQKFTGSAFGTLLGVARDSIEISGTLKTFTKVADSGNPIARHFCPECGSSIIEEPARRPGLVILNAGTLDDPTAVKPAIEIFCDRALPWVPPASGTKRFPGMPE